MLGRIRCCAIVPRRELALSVAIFGAFFAIPALAGQRSFVSTLGDDANVCVLTAPCRGFAKAVTVTDPGGEIVVLDSGGYGPVSVNKNVSIIAPAGVYAGISVFAASDGITVVAPATRVALRGLTINGQGGDHGIRVQAGEVNVENVVVSNMLGAGVLVEGGSAVRVSGTTLRGNVTGVQVTPGTGSVAVLLRESEVSGQTGNGVVVNPSSAGATAQVTLERTSVVKNAAGIVVSPTASASALVVITQSVASENAGAGISSTGAASTVFVRETTVSRNGTGLAQASSGVLNACGSNLLVANNVAQSGSINVNAAACLDQVSGGGTVTSVAVGTGLTGGPITTSGTIALAPTQLLPALACATNQIPTWSGSAWVCASAGVTSLTQGSGIALTPNPITATGTIAADTAYLQQRVIGTCAAGSSIRIINSDGTVVCETDDVATVANTFVQNGNAFGTTAALGTTDNQALDIRVNGSRAMRYEPNTTSPNVIGGHPVNNVTAGVRGAVINGGGVVDDPMWANEGPNRVTDHYGVIGGGYNNRAGDGDATVTNAGFATVMGGVLNSATAERTTVGGGCCNIASAWDATVGGGSENIASGQRATVAGGIQNTATSTAATVAGGWNNGATGTYSAIGGGLTNVASGQNAMVPGALATLHKAATALPPDIAQEQR